ncbi:MAG: DUF411 domain-containing protein [Burkholderiales bacterium]|jgi:hypothetical protein
MKFVNQRRREWCFLGLMLALPVHAQSSSPLPAAKPLVEVWKSPYCGCCKDWVTHLQKNGFAVKVTETVDTASQREKLGMPAQYGSCHTARVGGYVIEGHVPAREMHRLLKEKPKALGLAVPAMPIGSPGMDGPEYGNRRDPYQVLLVERDGRATVYQSY